MKNFLFALLTIFMLSCVSQKPDKEKVNDFFFSGEPEPVPKINNAPQDFFIIIDKHFKARNFTDQTESLLRKALATDDTTLVIYDMDKYRTANKPEKLKLYKEYYRALTKECDSLHRAMNKGQQEVWFINNSKDTLLVNGICGDPQLFVEKQNTDGTWKTVRYYDNCYIDGEAPILLQPGYGIRSITSSLPGKNERGSNYRLGVRAYVDYRERKKYYSNTIINGKAKTSFTKA